MPYDIGIANLSRTWCSTWQWSNLPVIVVRFSRGRNNSNQVEENISDSHTHKFMQTINVLKNENLCDLLAHFSVLSHGHFRVWSYKVISPQILRPSLSSLFHSIVLFLIYPLPVLVSVFIYWSFCSYAKLLLQLTWNKFLECSLVCVYIVITPPL